MTAFRVGIDENGLGPRLGPLVVTAVTAATEGDGNKRAESRPRGKLASRLGDSKALVSFGDTALGEAWARAVAMRSGAPASTPDEVARALSLDSADDLRRPCPRDHEAQCWATHDERFEASDEIVAAVLGDLDKLASLGVSISRVRVAIVCTQRLNDGIARGLSRFDLDLHAMERLALDARAATGQDVIVTCGKVGGFDRYAPHFGPLAGWLHTTIVEGRARSEYALPALGRLAFVRDADAGHMLVAMASLVGKWMRDLLMNRIVRYHRHDDETLPRASGYHDPVTSRFVEASALARKRRALPDACFERRSLARDAALAARES